MTTGADSRAGAILAGSGVARAFVRVCDAGAAAWVTSQTRRFLPASGERFPFWSTVVATAAATAWLARAFGPAL